MCIKHSTNAEHISHKKSLGFSVRLVVKTVVLHARTQCEPLCPCWRELWLLKGSYVLLRQLLLVSSARQTQICIRRLPGQQTCLLERLRRQKTRFELKRSLVQLAACLRVVRLRSSEVTLGLVQTPLLTPAVPRRYSQRQAYHSAHPSNTVLPHRPRSRRELCDVSFSEHLTRFILVAKCKRRMSKKPDHSPTGGRCGLWIVLRSQRRSI